MLLSEPIAKICGVNQTTICRWLRRFNIVRSRSERSHLMQANHCNLSQEANEFLNGELLGDGSLSNRSNYSSRFEYSSSKEKYLIYFLKTLKLFGIKQAGKIRQRYQKKCNCYTYHCSTLSYVELLPIYKQWYPNGKKIVPKGIKLTPSVCRQWYIGDGMLAKLNRQRPYIKLFTNGFTIFDVKWLIKQLNKLGFKSKRQLYNNSIRISTYSTKDFLDYIGKCPVKCYEYKWDY